LTGAHQGRTHPGDGEGGKKERNAFAWQPFGGFRSGPEKGKKRRGLAFIEGSRSVTMGKSASDQGEGGRGNILIPVRGKRPLPGVKGSQKRKKLLPSRKKKKKKGSRNRNSEHSGFSKKGAREKTLSRRGEKKKKRDILNKEEKRERKKNPSSSRRGGKRKPTSGGKKRGGGDIPAHLCGKGERNGRSPLMKSS